MRWAVLVLGGLAVAVVIFGAYVRLAPSDPARWHTDPSEGTMGANSHVARVVLPMSPEDALSAVDAAAKAEPRTARLAGSVEEGRITYVSRSRLWGFPDYTTVAVRPEGDGAALVIHARARFGESDLGVNAARVGRWLASGLGGQALTRRGG